MCIRDRINAFNEVMLKECSTGGIDLLNFNYYAEWKKGKLCLLYTSDAADERSSVDLGGRRIIKKKNMQTSKSRIMRLN